MSGGRPHIAGSGPAFPLAGGVLTIDLVALAANYRRLCAIAAPAAVAAVVKADAYGLGIGEVVPALVAAGCRDFFVALPHEGAAARAVAPGARIFVLSGPLDAESAPFYRRHRLVPVLNSAREIACWEAEGWDGETQLPAALHIDTGMNRLGLTPAEAARFGEENALTGAIRLCLVMSHLAVAEHAGDPLTVRQIKSFQRVLAGFPGVDSSLSSSAAAGIGQPFAGNLVRAGISLYGGSGGDGHAALAPVVTAEARVLQVRRAGRDETVGYGGAARLVRDSVLATVGVGYADGYPRATSGAGTVLRGDGSPGACGWIDGTAVPIVGRVSMDLTVFDVTDAGSVTEGDTVQLFGPEMPLDAVAQAAGTIGYELLTSLGRRYHRIYLRGEN